MSELNEKQKWILNWISSNDYRVDIYNKKFIDDYIERFSPNYIPQPYGANKVPEVGRLLSDMYKKYYLTRSRVGLTEMEVGFAKWVYVYEIVH